MTYRALGTDIMPAPADPGTGPYVTNVISPTPIIPSGGSNRNVPAWRQTMNSTLAAASSLFNMLPSTTKTAAAPVWQPVTELATWAVDPTKTDAQVISKAADVNSQYGSFRSNLSPDVLSIFDPIAALIANPTTTITQQPAPDTGIPWLWVGAGFVGGLGVCMVMSHKRKSVSANRRSRRNRRRR